MTPIQEAAAFHGMAINPMRPVDERLELALEALKRYEAEVERLRSVAAARYDLAIMYLRDMEAYANWAASMPGDYKPDSWPHHAADYLLARAPEEDK